MLTIDSFFITGRKSLLYVATLEGSRTGTGLLIQIAQKIFTIHLFSTMTTALVEMVIT